MGEDGGDGEAAGALDVHEEGSRGGDEGLEALESLRVDIDRSSYLELVLLGLGGRGGVQEINGENLRLLAVFSSSDCDEIDCRHSVAINSVVVSLAVVHRDHNKNALTILTIY